MRERKVVQLEDGTVRVEVGDRFYLVAGECPHRKGRMNFGYINERALRISCPLHRSTFDLTTGCTIAGPSEGPLPVFAANAASSASSGCAQMISKRQREAPV